MKTTGLMLLLSAIVLGGCDSSSDEGGGKTITIYKFARSIEPGEQIDVENDLRPIKIPIAFREVYVDAVAAITSEELDDIRARQTARAALTSQVLTWELFDPPPPHEDMQESIGIYVLTRDVTPGDKLDPGRDLRVLPVRFSPRAMSDLVDGMGAIISGELGSADRVFARRANMNQILTRDLLLPPADRAEQPQTRQTP